RRGPRAPGSAARGPPRRGPPGRSGSRFRAGPRSARERSGPVARAAHRGDVARSVRIVAQLVPQAADVDVDRSIEDLVLVAAIDVVEHLCAAEDAPVGCEERLEQAELDVRELDWGPADGDLVSI